MFETPGASGESDDTLPSECNIHAPQCISSSSNAN